MDETLARVRGRLRRPAGLRLERGRRRSTASGSAASTPSWRSEFFAGFVNTGAVQPAPRGCTTARTRTTSSRRCSRRSRARPSAAAAPRSARGRRAVDQGDAHRSDRRRRRRASATCAASRRRSRRGGRARRGHAPTPDDGAPRRQGGGARAGRVRRLRGAGSAAAAALGARRCASAIARGRPYLGICLGLQLLFEEQRGEPGAPGLRHPARARACASVRRPTADGRASRCRTWAGTDPARPGGGRRPAARAPCPTAPTSTSCTATTPRPRDPSAWSPLTTTYGGPTSAAAVRARQRARRASSTPKRARPRGSRCSSAFVRVAADAASIPAIDLLGGDVVRLVEGRREGATVYERRALGGGARASPPPAPRACTSSTSTRAFDGTADAATARPSRAILAEPRAWPRSRSAAACARSRAARRSSTRARGSWSSAPRPSRSRRWSTTPCRALPGRDRGRGRRARRARSPSRAGPRRTDVDAVEVGRPSARAGARGACSTPTSRATARASGPTSRPRRALARGARPSPVIASGGVGSLDDLRALAPAGASARSWSGKALYEGAFTIEAGGRRLAARPECWLSHAAQAHHPLPRRRRRPRRRRACASSSCATPAIRSRCAAAYDAQGADELVLPRHHRVVGRRARPCSTSCARTAEQRLPAAHRRRRRARGRGRARAAARRRRQGRRSTRRRSRDPDAGRARRRRASAARPSSSPSTRAARGRRRLGGVHARRPDRRPGSTPSPGARGWPRWARARSCSPAWTATARATATTSSSRARSPTRSRCRSSPRAAWARSSTCTEGLVAGPRGRGAGGVHLPLRRAHRRRGQALPGLARRARPPTRLTR